VSRAAELRRRLDDERILLLPGAADALSARIAEQVGFEAVYATGAGFANGSFALPDIGLISSTEIVAHVSRIADAIDVPLIVDADTGFGGVLQVRRTVQELERAGAAAIQLEDQVMPKRCGHFDGQQVVDLEEMVQKIKIACDTRQDPDLLIIARTDACNIEGFDRAVQRGRAYADAGADVIFVEAPTNQRDLERLPSLIDAPLLANMVEGGKTPVLKADELQELGFRIALFANTALRVSALAVLDAMRTLLTDGGTHGLDDRILSWDSRQQLVRLDHYQSIETKYTESP